MNCSACGHANRDQARFCEQCAAPFAPVAEPVRDVRAYTPAHLSAKILASRKSLEGERKQVTVLFADLKGSMDLSEEIDPEEWHRIMDRFFQILTDGVHRFEGTVNQYTGDGIMALFGAPIAHEDHAARACYAALSLREDLRSYANELRIAKGINFSVRMGLNSGEVVIGTIGDNLRMDYTALGHTASLGARMEQIAEPGKCYLSEHTRQLVGGLFALKDLGRMSVKGVREPIGVCELEGIGKLRTKLELSRARGFSRFVGRREEMAVLEGALARALQGSGQVVGVVADPGVGKSRLCHEFVERSRARGVAVFQAHGLAHGRMVPFLPVLELLREFFGVVEKDDDRTAREKVERSLLLLDPSFENVLLLVFDFLAVADPTRPSPPMGPEERQGEVFRFLKRLTHAQTRREPTIIVLEDLHWWDAGSLAFAENQVEIVAGTRMLLLVNFRPEYHAAWMQKSYYEQLALRPLDARATAEMLVDLLGTDPSLAALADRIRERTGGNPFFVEEMAQSLGEGGALTGGRGGYRLAQPIDQVSLPRTVQAVLAARIDRLAARDKAVLQTAAVIGKEFVESILRAACDLTADEVSSSLRTLGAAEFLYEIAVYPEAEFAFKHPLTQEVAYGSQLTDQRRRMHARVARAIAALYADRLDERAALLAYHWEAAGEQIEAATWYRRAAQWAGANDPGEALRDYQKVRQLLGNAPETKELVSLAIEARARILNFAFYHGLPAEEIREVFAEGRELAVGVRDLHGLVDLMVMNGAYHYLGARPAEALDSLNEAVRIADQLGDRALSFTSRMALYQAYFFVADLERGLTIADEFMEISRNEPTLLGKMFPGAAAWTSGMNGYALIELGRLRDGEEILRQCVALARELGENTTVCWAECLWTRLCERAGDGGAALRHSEVAVEFAERTRGTLSLVFAYAARGAALVSAERSTEAIESLERAIRLCREKKTFLALQGMILTDLARALLASGDAQGAVSTAAEAVAFADSTGIRVWECGAQLAQARALRALEAPCDRTRIDAALARASELIETTGARLYEPFLHEEYAALSEEKDSRERELREAHRLFTLVGAHGHAERLRSELGI